MHKGFKDLQCPGLVCQFVMASFRCHAHTLQERPARVGTSGYSFRWWYTDDCFYSHQSVTPVRVCLFIYDGVYIPYPMSHNNRCWIAYLWSVSHCQSLVLVFTDTTQSGQLIRFRPSAMPQEFKRYFDEFDTVELNNTFYKIPATTTWDKWRLKASRIRPSIQFVVSILVVRIGLTAICAAGLSFSVMNQSSPAGQGEQVSDARQAAYHRRQLDGVVEPLLGAQYLQVPADCNADHITRWLQLPVTDSAVLSLSRIRDMLFLRVS